jgi:hypothetical protein
MTVQIVDPGKVAIVEVPSAWTASEAQREQTRVMRNVTKNGADVQVVVVRGGAGESAGSVEDILDEESASAE